MMTDRKVYNKVNKINAPVESGIKTVPVFTPNNVNSPDGTNYGPYVEFIAATTSIIYITNIIFSDNTQQQDKISVDISVGAAGSEVVKAQLWSRHITNVNAVSNLIMPIPLKIPTGSRVAVRIRGSHAGSVNFPTVLQYVET